MKLPRTIPSIPRQRDGTIPALDPVVARTWAGERAALRPLEQAESGALLAVFEGMSVASRADRYLVGLPALPASMLAALTAVDGYDHSAWLATILGLGALVTLDVWHARRPHEVRFREALTWSCNTYFAHVAETLQPGELGQMLRRTALLGATGLARDEATADFREPQNAAEEQLAVLGVVGVRVTPLELAEAYRWLALQMAAHLQSGASQVVMSGLRARAASMLSAPSRRRKVAAARR